MATVERTVRGSSTAEIGELEMVVAGPRMDWLGAVLATLMVGGFYLDLWAHRHGQVDNTFFTPWHAVLYGGVGAFGLFVALAWARNVLRGRPWARALSAPYRLSLAGFVLFMVAGVADLVWHSLFGFEVSTEALLSPTHLALALSGLVMISGPVRSAFSASAQMANAVSGRAAGWVRLGPAVLGLALMLAVFGAFTQYAHPIVAPWPESIPGRAEAPPAQLYGISPDGSGQHRLTVGDGDLGMADVSPDGSKLAFTRTVDGQSHIAVAGIDGSNVRELTAAGDSTWPAWSPDGTRIAFNSTREGNRDVFVMGADGSNVTALTDDPAEDASPAWSPDGTAIVFTSNRSGNYDLFRLPAGGGRANQITNDPADEYDPAWSPDGTQIAFTSRRDSHGWQVWVVPADGSGTARRLTDRPGDSWMPAWSPDGARIAFTTNRDGDLEVYATNVDGSGVTDMSQNPGIDDGGTRIDWSHDGKTIVYASQAAEPAWRVDFVRQNLGAASVLLQAALLAGFVLYALRRGPLPFGSLTVLLALPAALATVLADQYRFIPAALIAGLLADVLVRRLGYRGDRRRDALVAFAVPALFFAGYFATIALTSSIGWSIHLWLGAILLAGAAGLLLDELGRGSTRRFAADV